MEIDELHPSLNSMISLFCRSHSTVHMHARTVRTCPTWKSRLNK